MSSLNKKTLKLNGDTFTVYLTEDKIQKRIRQLGRKISLDFKNRTPIFVGVLNGSFVFMSDLIRNITIDCEIDFFKLSSYGDAKISSGNVRLLKGLDCQIENRDIIIVEDIVDSGLSLDFIKKMIIERKPRTFKIVTLLYKSTAVKIPISVEYIGFKIPNYFVVGYGLDYSQRVRHLRNIYRLVEK